MERCGEVGKRFKAALVFGLGDELDVDRNFHKSWYKAKSANTYFETHIPRCENLKSFSALQDFFFFRKADAEAASLEARASRRQSKG